MSYYEYWRDRTIAKIDMFVHNFHWEQHVHRTLEIQCVTGERLDLDLDGNEYRAVTGEVCLISSGMPHAMTDTGDNYALLVPPNYLDVWFDSVADLHPADPIIRGDNAKRIIELILAVKQYFSASPVKLMSKLYEILDICYDSCEFVAKQVHKIKRENYDTISKLMEYIDENYMNDITLDALANEFGYNKNYLSSLLHKELNMNFRDFINQRRLDVMALNYRPDVSLDEQWDKFGFNSRQTFYRAFKKQYSMTPAEYYEGLVKKK